MSITIDIENQQDGVSVDAEELANLYQACLQSLGIESAELSVLIVDEEEMARLNREQMGVEGPTDVLSFPQNEFNPATLAQDLREAAQILPEGAELVLGDIVLCPSVILAQAPQGPWDEQAAAELEPTTALVGRCPEPPGPESQMHLVAVHGLLHLLGHDHATLEQARTMAEAQDKLLETGFEFTLLAEEDEDTEGEGEGEEAEELPEPGPDFRTGYIALIGRPNVGKSTLMNALVKEKISIASPKPQTTRNRIVGIWTDERAQVLFLDTPGLHRPRDGFNQRLVQTALGCLGEADLIFYMTEPNAFLGPEEEFVLESLRQSKLPKFLLINKVDKVAKPALLPVIEAMRQRGDWQEIFPISALEGTNLPELLASAIEQLPKGKPLYPADQLTDQPERFIASERVREKVFQFTQEELPYAVAVSIEHWQEEGKLLKIYAKIHVEREGQKAIVIGKGGSMLKKIGTEARKELEDFFACKVYLQLHVVVSERWRQSEAFLRDQNI